jgi:5,10-methylenetetrahydromethanopterin reductase
METRRDVIVDTPLLAESLGYEVFSLAEGWAYYSTAMLSFIAARTQRVRLLPRVFSVWSRTPAVLAMAAALVGQRATTAVTGARPLRLGLTPTPELPIWIGATGDLATQVVAEAADGWYPLLLTLRNLQSRGDEIASARGEGNPVTVAAGPFVVAGPGARDIAASRLAWYICAMGDGYATLIADQGYGDAVEAVISANPRPTLTRAAPMRSLTPPLPV